MVSGRYKTEMLCRFWTTNRSGACLAETCENVPGTLEHLLIECPAIEHTRHRLRSLWCLKTINCPPLHRLILEILGSSPEHQVKFILNSTAFPELIKLVQAYGQELQNTVLYLTRTYAFAIHRQKMIHLGRWPNNSDKQTRRPVMTNTETDKDNSAVAKFLNNNICVAGHPTLRPCPPCTSWQAVPGPGSAVAGASLTVPETGSSHPDQESSSHQQLSPGHAVHAAAPLRPYSIQPMPGLAAGIADCSRRSQLSGDCSFAPGQHPTPTRHAPTLSDHTSSKVTASKCNKYGSMGAHIPS